MRIIKLNLGRRSYNIIVGTNILGLLGRSLGKLNLGTDAYVITNASIKNKYGALLQKSLIKSGFKIRFKLVPDTEKSKSMKIVSSVIHDLASYDKKKRIFIIAFGGGVIGDLAGFVASIYKRGIDYIQVPTTILAQVDSSIGGKTAVDLEHGKNLVGAFYQPRLVFSDTKLLKTLSPRQIKSGLAEVIKYGIIKDPELFRYLERHYHEILSLRRPALEFIISHSSRIKAKVVQEDEREERGRRTILNFGHTIGHAIELAGGFQGHTHGEAISLGMLAATYISQSLKLITSSTSQRIKGLINSVGLPVKVGKISMSKIIKAHYRDKKFIGPKNRFVLIERIGRTKIVHNIPLAVIKDSLLHIGC